MIMTRCGGDDMSLTWRRCIVAVVIAVAAHIGCLSQVVDTTAVENQAVGLVLSGGGAKGIAHIGVIQALEDNDIPIDYVCGTSMGAIVGGLYAAGYTPDEMLALMLSKDFMYWSTGQIDPKRRFYFNTSRQTPTMLSVDIGGHNASSASSTIGSGSPGLKVPSSLISPLPMNFAFMELFSAYTDQCKGDFDKLFVPYRCVAADVADKRKVVLSSGSLGDAIRASMSFPIVFQPTRINGKMLYDGGIYDNFPFDVMRHDFAPSIMIGVDVSTPSSGPATSIMDQLDNLVVQDGDYNLPADEGIRIHVDLRRYNLLDFAKAQEIYNIGYRQAVSMMDSIKARVTARRAAATLLQRRNAFKAHTPYLHFDTVAVSGATPRQNKYIKYLFDRNKADTFGIKQAKESFYRAVSSGKLRDLQPHAIANDTTGLFTLDLAASVKNNFRIGFGGYITSSVNSFVFLSADYSTLSFSSINAYANAYVGQSLMAGILGARLFLHTHTPSALELEGVATRSKFSDSDRLFYDDSNPSFIIDHEYFGRLQWSIAAGAKAKFDVGGGYGHLHSRYYPNNRIESYRRGHDHAYYNLGQAYAAFTSNTVDDVSFPTKGAFYQIKAMGVLGNYRLDRPAAESPDDVAAEASEPTPAAMQETQMLTYARHSLKWLQVELRSRNYWELSKHFALGLESDIMLSTRELLQSYGASITGAPDFAPTPSSRNAFAPAFRANSFIAAGVVPIYRFNDNLTARLQCYGFMPLREICEVADTDTAVYGRWFHSPEFFGEADVTYRFPFASLNVYANYSTSPGAKWNVGISFGIYILPPKFLR